MLVQRRRRVSRAAAIALAGALSLGSLAPPAAALTRLEERLHGLINGARRNHGIRELRAPRWLSKKAHNHSVRMSREGRLFHTQCLSCMFRSRRYDQLGENVGLAGTVKRVHTLMMNNSSHRSNILGRVYHSVGVGVKKGRRGVWVTEIFWG